MIAYIATPAEMALWVLAIGWLACAALAGRIADRTGQYWLGVALGFVLGPLGVIAACLLPRREE